MSFLGNFISDLVKLPDRTVNFIGSAINDVGKTVVATGSNIGDFIGDIPNKVAGSIDNNINFVIKQVEKVQDLGSRGMEKFGMGAGKAIGLIGDPLLKNPVVGGVALAGSGSALLLSGAAALAALFILKKF